MRYGIYLLAMSIALLAYILPVAAIGGTAGATIDSVTWEPENPTTSDMVTIHAKVSGDVQKVQLKYEACTATMCGIIQTKDMVKSGDEYTATVGPFDGKEQLKFKVVVTDSSGNTVESNEFVVNLSPPSTGDDTGSENEEEKKSTPGFEGVLAFIAMVAVVPLVAQRKRM